MTSLEIMENLKYHQNKQLKQIIYHLKTILNHLHNLLFQFPNFL